MFTLDQLKRRGMTFANRCFLCEEDGETIEHLLIQCKSAKMSWNLFLLVVGASWVFPPSVLHTLVAWQGHAVGKKHKKIWMVAPLCLFWTLWCTRNRLVFENEVTFAQRIRANFVTNLWTWANLYRIDNMNSVLDFLTCWGVGRVFGFVPDWICWLPFVHDLCTLGNFFYLYNICFFLIKKIYLKLEPSIQNLDPNLKATKGLECIFFHNLLINALK